MWRDLRYGLRQLKRYPLHSAVIVLLLSVGTAANAVLLGFVDTLLLQPLPVRNPDNLYLFEKNIAQQARPDTEFVYAQYEGRCEERRLRIGHRRRRTGTDGPRDLRHGLKFAACNDPDRNTGVLRRPRHKACAGAAAFSRRCIR